MSDSDALSKFDFSKVTGGGLFLKFTPGEPIVIRVLTVDPIVTSESFEDKRTNETVVQTKFSFIVYNWTEEKAQILKATPNMAKQIGELHTDPDFGANIRKVDLKITPPNKGEIKAYDIQVLPKAREMTSAQVEECQNINLDEKVDGQRMSFYEPIATAAKAEEDREEHTPGVADAIVEDLGGDINLDDIPF